MGRSDGPREPVFEVRIEGNLVRSIRAVVPGAGAAIPDSRLEVSAQLARNQIERGCIDGSYLFADAERARSFAVLALDFVKCLAERRMEQVRALDTGAPFEADEAPAQRR